MKILSLLLVLSIPLFVTGNFNIINDSITPSEEKVETSQLSYETSGLSNFVSESQKQSKREYLFTWCRIVEETQYNDEVEVCLDIYEETQYCCESTCGHSIKTCQGCIDVCRVHTIVQ